MSLNLTGDCSELRAKFLALQTREDIANLLEISEHQLIYHLYISNSKSRYTTFQIPKKTGGFREITAPATGLKIIQQKANQVFQCIYEPKASVHGFLHHRSILTNAQSHLNKNRKIFNIDLEDFFPTINFGRVRGMFMATPYKRNPEVATILAQICCFDNQLPQGAPTSPIISNMICAKMDSQLLRLAQKQRCIYTRYADDITFSTSLREFPHAVVATSKATGMPEPGAELISIITGNGFNINPQKTRLAKKSARQEVTGITINENPNLPRTYIRQIRAMLHAWRKYGLPAAQTEYLDKYKKSHTRPGSAPPDFKQVVRGKLEFLRMVKGASDPVFLGLMGQLSSLDQQLAGNILRNKTSDRKAFQPVVITEGKTDWKHLKNAFSKLKSTGYEWLDIEFKEYSTPKGDEALLSMCKEYSQAQHGRPWIFVFDRDNAK